MSTRASPVHGQGARYEDIDREQHDQDRDHEKGGGGADTERIQRVYLYRFGRQIETGHIHGGILQLCGRT